MALFIDVDGESGKGVTVKKLKELLAGMEDDYFITVNRVDNLSILKTENERPVASFGFIDMSSEEVTWWDELYGII
jgi:hypothetical protein